MARPLKYKTVAELQAAIDQYFDGCRGRPLLDDAGKAVCDKYGVPIVVDAHPPTVTGLALALGFSSRQALLNYQGKKQFHDTITRAKARCEEYAESRLYDRDGANGAKFSLEYNFRWQQPAAEPAAAPQDGLLPALSAAAQTVFAAGDDSTSLPLPEGKA